MNSFQIISGQELPAQFHLGRTCTTGWVKASDRQAVEGALSVKPSNVLWTAPKISDSEQGRVATVWSDTYFRRGYDAQRQKGASVLSQIKGAFRPERQWPIVPDADNARVVRLSNGEDLRSASAQWPGEHGRISFEAMAADGIDAVWVQPGAIPNSWSSEHHGNPHANLYAQFYGWEVESVAWLRPDHLTVGPAAPASRELTEQQRQQSPGLVVDAEVSYAGQNSAEELRPLDSDPEVTRNSEVYRVSFPQAATQATRPGNDAGAAPRVGPQRGHAVGATVDRE